MNNFMNCACARAQFAAFYEWLWRGAEADAVIHFGMHGTVEWLPGSPLGDGDYIMNYALIT